jgi:hypothetical protein
MGPRLHDAGERGAILHCQRRLALSPELNKKGVDITLAHRPVLGLAPLFSTRHRRA